jgi:hypothetical protein
MYIGEGYLRVVPAQDLELNVNVPPFRRFLIEKVLKDVKRKDRGVAERGEVKRERGHGLRGED